MVSLAEWVAAWLPDCLASGPSLVCDTSYGMLVRVVASCRPAPRVSIHGCRPARLTCSKRSGLPLGVWLACLVSPVQSCKMSTVLHMHVQRSWRRWAAPAWRSMWRRLLPAASPACTSSTTR